MSNTEFSCEVTPQPGKEPKGHLGPFYFCNLCELVVCTSCMISHLCFIHHPNPDVLQPIEEYLSSMRTSINSLHNKIVNYQNQLAQESSSSEKTNLVKLKINIIHTKGLELISHINSILSSIDNYGNLILAETQKTSIKAIEQSSYGLELKNLSSVTEKLKLQWEASKEKIELAKTYSNLNKFFEDIKSRIKEEKSKKEQINGTSRIKEFENLMEEMKIGTTFDFIKDSLCNLLQIMKNMDVPIENVIKSVEKERIAQTLSNFSVDRNPPSSPSHSQKIPHQSKSLTDNFSNIQPQQLQVAKNPTTFEFPYTCDSLLFLKNNKEKQSPSADIIYYTDGKTYVIPLSYDFFCNNCYTPFFPYKNNKSINIGNALIVTGGIVEATLSPKVYLIVPTEEKKLQVKALKNLITARESHNIAFIPKSKKIIVASGQNNQSAEFLDLSNLENEWESLPNMNNVRANGTMFVINETNVYCVGGYNHKEETYQSSYEYLDMNHISKGWKGFYAKEQFSISTMGIVNLDRNHIMLVGGFQGGRKYLIDGLILTFEKEGQEILHIDKKENILEKGVIFYSSQQFYKIGDEYLNFDFKYNKVIFDQTRLKFSIIQEN